ncbi:MAG: hypothetical protein Q9M91_06320 [Candidatus Dojkabacteria bacterium]|nr:hypothetical protein [Candidatus Dojkabacteria bacterium]MDQ7021411.1 hypothetical protein [Candidatus Dojkabacteria bacterium]
MKNNGNLDSDSELNQELVEGFDIEVNGVEYKLEYEGQLGTNYSYIVKAYSQKVGILDIDLKPNQPIQVQSDVDGLSEAVLLNLSNEDEVTSRVEELIDLINLEVNCSQSRFNVSIQSVRNLIQSTCVTEEVLVKSIEELLTWQSGNGKFSTYNKMGFPEVLTLAFAHNKCDYRVVCVKANTSNGSELYVAEIVPREQINTVNNQKQVFKKALTSKNVYYQTEQ